MEQQLNLAVKIAVDNWNSTLARTTKTLDEITDEDLHNEVSPGRNTGIYLLGHLVAVHDRMLPLLGIGAQRYPQLDEIFLTSPDKSGKAMPTVADLRAKWAEVNSALTEGFNAMQPADWLNRHNSVSEEDFAKQPHRNKLSVLASRTTHLAEHYGQLLFLKKKA
jgi:DinB superfamily